MKERLLGPKKPRQTLHAVAARYNARHDDPALKDLPVLSEQHQMFVSGYVQHFNAARAARDAGYSPATARSIGWELLTRPDIQAHCNYAKAQLGELHFDLNNQLTAQLRMMLSADITSILDADGNLTDPQTWGEPEKLLLAGLDVEERMTGEGDGGEFVRTKKVKLLSRLSVIDQLSKIVGLYVEKRQMLGKDGKPIDPSAILPPVINLHFPEMPKNAHRAGQKPPEPRAAKASPAKR